MTVLDLSWMENPEWYEYDDDWNPIIKDTAPEEIKERYKRFLIQVKEAEKRGAM